MGASSDDLLVAIVKDGRTRLLEGFKWSDKIVHDLRFGWHSGGPGDLDDIETRFEVLFPGDGLPKRYGAVVVDFDARTLLSFSDYGMADKLGVSDVASDFAIALRGWKTWHDPESEARAKASAAGVAEAVAAGRMALEQSGRKPKRIDPSTTPEELLALLEGDVVGFLRQSPPDGWTVVDLSNRTRRQALSSIRAHLEHAGASLPDWSEAMDDD